MLEAWQDASMIAFHLVLSHKIAPSSHPCISECLPGVVVEMDSTALVEAVLNSDILSILLGSCSESSWSRHSLRARDGARVWVKTGVGRGESPEGSSFTSPRHSWKLSSWVSSCVYVQGQVCRGRSKARFSLGWEIGMFAFECDVEQASDFDSDKEWREKR